jgi:3-carboxy-cis,cis-muconate cycloisomerase
MRDAFSDRALLTAILRYESAWAGACVDEGLIPMAASVCIVQACESLASQNLSLEAATRLAGNPVLPLVDTLRAEVASRMPEARAHVHFCATTQDVLDTARCLQMVTAHDWLDKTLGFILEALRGLVETHRTTPCLARTLMRQARPTTFGLLGAQWHRGIEDARAGLRDLRARLPLQYGGPSGTLEGLGAAGLAVAARTAKALDLQLPALPWHTHRSYIVETGAALGLLVGTAGKIAKDISLLSQDEVRELDEPWTPGRGASTAMAHKRNPIGCAAILAQATRVPGMVATLFSALPQEHSRALGGWQAEWETLPEIWLAAAGVCTHLKELCSGLQVFPARMRENLAAAGWPEPDPSLDAGIEALLARAFPTQGEP